MIPRKKKKKKQQKTTRSIVDGAITGLAIYVMPNPQIEVVDLVSAVAADVFDDITNVKSDKALEIDDIVSIVTGGVGCEPGYLAQITNLTPSCVYFKILDGPRSRRARKNVTQHAPSSHTPTERSARNTKKYLDKCNTQVGTPTERMTSSDPTATPPRQTPRRPFLSMTIC